MTDPAPTIEIPRGTTHEMASVSVYAKTRDDYDRVVAENREQECFHSYERMCSWYVPAARLHMTVFRPTIEQEEDLNHEALARRYRGH